MQSYATDPDVVHRAGGHAGLFTMRMVGRAGTLVSRIADNLAPVVVLIKFGLGGDLVDPQREPFQIRNYSTFPVPYHSLFFK